MARIELGLQDELVHGNLKSVRTLIDVRDAMAAYWAAIDHCVPGEAYNIGGKTSIEVGEFLEILCSKSTASFPCRVDSKLLRPTDVTLQIPNTEKFTRVTGWTPRYDFEESIDLLLEYWRQRCRDDLALREDAGAAQE